VPGAKPSVVGEVLFACRKRWCLGSDLEDIGIRERLTHPEKDHPYMTLS